MSIRAHFIGRKLDQRVQFDRLVQMQDATGNPVPSWAPKGKCWAAVDGARANGEPVITNGIRSVSDLTVWVRSEVFKRLALVVTDRMVWEGRNYDISDIPNQQLRGRFIALLVRTGVNKG
jgi:SPP1 family predicted phage head-tail adaptor